MAYKIKGTSGRTGRTYTSKKTFNSQESALKWGYKQVYQKNGNIKRKNPPFTSWHLIQIKR